MKSARNLRDAHLGYGWLAVWIRFGFVALVGIAGAANVNFQDPIWGTEFIVALITGLIGGGILAWQSWTGSESILSRYCGYALLIIGIGGLLAVSFILNSLHQTSTEELLGFLRNA